MSLPKNVKFEGPNPANSHRHQYLKAVNGSWTVVTNEVSSFTPDELRAIADHMEEVEEKLPYEHVSPEFSD